jgi:pilus assembly protein TadC
MVQVSSGVPLYNAIADIALTKKNDVAYEFEKIIKLTQQGVGLSHALEENASKNPSHFYKMAILQIANSLRSGTDIAKAISEIITSITKEQRISMKIYSSQLNILTMIYMILTIILPTLGIVLLVILSNFVSLILSLPLYVLLLVVLTLIQYLFVGLIESRRPVVAV